MKSGNPWLQDQYGNVIYDKSYHFFPKLKTP